jgi:hypothetical protein
MVLAPTNPHGRRLRKRYGKVRSHLFPSWSIRTFRRTTTAASRNCGPQRPTAKSPAASVPTGEAICSPPFDPSLAPQHGGEATRIRLFAPFCTGNLSFCRVEQIRKKRLAGEAAVESRAFVENIRNPGRPGLDMHLRAPACAFESTQPVEFIRHLAAFGGRVDALDNEEPITIQRTCWQSNSSSPSIPISRSACLVYMLFPRPTLRLTGSAVTADLAVNTANPRRQRQRGQAPHQSQAGVRVPGCRAGLCAS